MTETAHRLAFSTVHSQIEQFYARQMQYLDEGDAVRWAHTFTEDGVFESNGAPPLRGRSALEDGGRAAVAKLADAGTTRRHLISNIVVEPDGAGLLRTTSYVPVFDTTDGQVRLTTSTVMRDEVVSVDGQWLVRHRMVERDDITAGGSS